LLLAGNSAAMTISAACSSTARSPESLLYPEETLAIGTTCAERGLLQWHNACVTHRTKKESNMPTTEVRPNFEHPQHTASPKTNDIDRRLDEAIEESFPASDPPAISDPHADKTAVDYGTAVARRTGSKMTAIITGGVILALAGWLGRRVLTK
jgi:hypothetical protein